MREHRYYVYILASRPDGALYIGVTNNLSHRIHAHREGKGGQHTMKYKNHRLVYYEVFDRIDEAIAREKKLKRWKRVWKDDLIVKTNPAWQDLRVDGLYD